MDYLKKIEESLIFTWKYKSLWAFGLILAIFSGGGSNFGSWNNSSFNDSDATTEISDGVSSFFENSLALMLVCGVIFFVLIIALIEWYLTSVSKAALVNAVRMEEKGEIPNFKNGWAYGKTKAFKYMVMDLIALLLSIVVFLPMIFVLIGASLFPPIIVVLCILALIYIPYFILFSLTYTAAQRYIVLKDLEPMESLKAGWELTKSKFGDYFIGALVSIIPNCIWGIIMLPVAILAVVLFVVAAVVIVAALPVVFAVIFIIMMVLIFLLLVAAINSPFQVYNHTYWTKIIKELMD